MINLDFIKLRILEPTIPLLSDSIIEEYIDLYGGDPDATHDPTDLLFDWGSCVSDLLNQKGIILGVKGGIGDSLRIDTGQAMRMLLRESQKYAGQTFEYIMNVDDILFIEDEAADEEEIS